MPNAQLKWDLLKYKVLKFTNKYSRKLAKKSKENRTLLDNKLKELKGNLNTEVNIQSYDIYKRFDSNDHIAEGIRIQSSAIGMNMVKSFF